jgi:predicted nucleic acid-binding protein
MVVISDTSPINYLVLIDHAWLLQSLYGEVVVPQAVREELADPRSPASVRDFIRTAPPWLVFRAPASPQVFRIRFGPGESQAISLCLECNPDLLLIDDRPARSLAESLGIRCAGLLGAVQAAHRRQIIDGPSVLALLRQTSMFIPDRFSF